jgi:hypothetical protein
MRTRIQFILSGILLVGLLSCSKDNDNDNDNGKVKTKMELITQKTWVYDEFITDYDESPTVLAYKRGKTNNSYDLSLVTVKFNTDGSYTETLPNGAVSGGTWKFLNNETQTEVKNTSGTYTSTIITLADNNFIWRDPSRSGGILAKLINQ